MSLFFWSLLVLITLLLLFYFWPKTSIKMATKILGYNKIFLKGDKKSVPISIFYLKKIKRKNNNNSRKREEFRWIITDDIDNESKKILIKKNIYLQYLKTHVYHKMDTISNL